MLNYVALFMLFFVIIVMFYGIIAIHDIPYEMAKKRQHPHQDAIHVAGWISLFTLHVIWPFLWIWATLYKPGFGWGMGGQSAAESAVPGLKQSLEALQQRIEALEQRGSQG